MGLFCPWSPDGRLQDPASADRTARALCEWAQTDQRPKMAAFDVAPEPEMSGTCAMAS